MKDIDKSCEFYERASVETKIILEKIPRASIVYIPQDVEESFVQNLLEKDPKMYCWYILYKIYHWMFEVYKIRLKKMIAEFSYDVFGNLW